MCAFAVGPFKNISVATTQGRVRSMHFEVPAARRLERNRLLPGMKSSQDGVEQKEKRGKWWAEGALEAAPSTAVQSI